MFVLEGTVTIGDYEFKSIHNIEFTKSVDDLVDTAIIQLPTKFKIKQNNVLTFTEEAIKVGDTVAITVGYKGVYSKTEFVGYVRKIVPKIPIEIHCEDAMWLLRRKKVAKVWNESTSLKEVLNYILKDTPIKLSRFSADAPFKGYVIKNGNGAQELQRLKNDLPLAIFLNDDNELYCGFRLGTNIGEEAAYDLNYNIIENNLEFKTKEERKIRVTYTYTDEEGNKKEAQFGDTSGEEVKYKTSIISNEDTLNQMAQEQIKLKKFDGFEGNVKTFLVPFATRGMKAKIIDDVFTNRQGSYFITKVKTTFGTSCARRDVTFGTKL